MSFINKRRCVEFAAQQKAGVAQKPALSPSVSPTTSPTSSPLPQLPPPPPPSADVVRYTGEAADASSERAASETSVELDVLRGAVNEAQAALRRKDIELARFQRLLLGSSVERGKVVMPQLEHVESMRPPSPEPQPQSAAQCGSEEVTRLQWQFEDQQQRHEGELRELRGELQALRRTRGHVMQHTQRQSSPPAATAHSAAVKVTRAAQWWHAAVAARNSAVSCVQAAAS